MSDWTLLNSRRVRDGLFATRDTDGFNGAFLLWIGSERVKCIASDDMGFQHVSVSLMDHPNRVPKWEIMCGVKDIFWEPEDWVVQFHPAKSEYVEDHPGCLHLWKPTDQSLPVPPSFLVGYKKKFDNPCA